MESPRHGPGDVGSKDRFPRHSFCAFLLLIVIAFDEHRRALDEAYAVTVVSHEVLARNVATGMFMTVASVTLLLVGDDTTEGLAFCPLRISSTALVVGLLYPAIERKRSFGRPYLSREPVG